MDLPNPLISHVLIGPPGCGKSTLAQEWITRSPRYVWVSTDQIRAVLYGDASVQGNWTEVEAEVLHQIQTAIATDHPVIYDATNARRAWRLQLMQTLNNGKTHWMAWQFKTSLETCKARNQNRDRQVEPWVIERAHRSLEQFKPIPAEGFAAVNPVPMQNGWFDFAEMEQRLRSLPRTLQQRANKQATVSPHAYSSLLEFERLLYLIATLLRHPGLGYLHQTNPALLQRELQVQQLPHVATPAEEISALISRQQGSIYADVAAIERNLKWLERNGIINCGIYSAEPLDLPSTRHSTTLWYHRYSDREPFERLIQTIRFLVHHPFLQPQKQARKGRLHQTLVDTMTEYGLQGLGEDSVRRDISEILKPYGLMEKTVMTKGYFVGTAILAQHELLRVFASLEGQAKRLDDPISLQAYETFQERLQCLQLDTSNMYPVRTVINQPIAHPDYLPANSLALPSQAEFLESAIAQGEVLELRRLRGTGRFPKEDDHPFLALPLQIVFYSIGWYLGYIRREDGLLQFERLDRLTANPTGFTRPRSYQNEARQQLHSLQKAGFGLFLGKSAKEQQQFLSRDVNQQATITDTLELWFTNELFRFISEGTQRFGTIELSDRIDGSRSQAEGKSIFTLKPTGNVHFPNRLRATLPRWVLQDDYDLKAWILRFGSDVKVITPKDLADDIQQRAKNILEVYQL
jgi:predicted kinase